MAGLSRDMAKRLMAVPKTAWSFRVDAEPHSDSLRPELNVELNISGHIIQGV